MKTKCTLIALLAAVLLASSCKREGLSPVDYVNPYIGSISHMLVPTHPTIHLPNSMMRVYPLRTDFTGNRLNGLPLIVTRHRSASTLNFFPHQQADPKVFTMPEKSLGYSHEKITPYRYTVYLDEIDVQADYAPSHQSAVYNLVFDPAQTPYLIFSFPRGQLQAKAHTISG